MKKFAKWLLALSLVVVSLANCGKTETKSTDVTMETSSVTEARSNGNTTQTSALAKNRVYVNARYVKSVIDNEQPESKNYVIAYVNYGAEPDDAYKKAHIPGAIVVGDVDVEDATGSKEGA